MILEYYHTVVVILNLLNFRSQRMQIYLRATVNFNGHIQELGLYHQGFRLRFPFRLHCGKLQLALIFVRPGGRATDSPGSPGFSHF